MTRNPYSNAIYVFIGKAPLLIFFGFVIWLAFFGLLKLEVRSYGTEYFVSNAGTANRWANAKDRQADTSQLVEEAAAAASQVQSAGGISGGGASAGEDFGDNF